MEKSIKNKARIVVIAAAMIIQIRNSVSLIISHLIQNFPEQSTTTCQLVFTSLSGFAVIGSLLYGVLSTKVSMKNAGLIAMLSIAGGATIAVLFGSGNIGILFFASFFIGVGCGIVSPWLGSVIAEYFPGSERAKMIGIQNISATCAGLIYPMVGGYLIAVNWVYHYMVFYVSIPILILILLLLPNEKREAASVEGGKEKVTPWTPPVICWVAQMFLFGICWITFNNNATALFAELGFENYVSLTSRAMALFAGVGIFVSAGLSKMCAKFGRKLMNYCLLLAVAGVFLPFFARTQGRAWLLFLSSALISCSFGTFFAGGYVFIPQVVDFRALSKALAYFAAASMLGSFISPYVITATANLFSPSIYTRFLLAGILAAGNAVFGLAAAKYTCPKEQL